MKINLTLLIKVIAILFVLQISNYGQIGSIVASKPSGSGTSADPYQISSRGNLSWLAQNSSEWDKYYIQTKNILMSQTKYWDDTDDDGDGDLYNDSDDQTSSGSNEGFPPIGNTTTKFTGSYDGQGYYIGEITINRPGEHNVGFFGYVEGTVKNLGTQNVDIEGGVNVGAVIGKLGLSGTLSGSFGSGTITGGYYVGFVGQNYHASISTCFSSCNINSDAENAGGLVGYNYYASIDNCYSTGNVTRTSGTNTTFGGFCGENDNSSITKCYSTGSVTYTGSTAPTDKGFIGKDSAGTFTANFFDKTQSNQTTDAAGGATAQSTSQLQNVATYTNVSSDAWDFVGTPNDDSGTDDYWAINPTENNGLPFLEWQDDYTNYLIAPTSGDGSSGNPYQIDSLQNLYWLTQNPDSWDKYYVQTNDINASITSSWNIGDFGHYYGFLPIGNFYKNFSGNYNGQEHVIDSLFINRETYVGLLGYASGTMEISNLGLSDINFTGASGVGGFVGSASGSSTKIKNCYITGKVEGASYTGGFVGKITSTTITDCYSRTDITRSNGNETSFGGFVGYINGATIKNCYSTGSIIYDEDTDPTNKGFAGHKDGTCSLENNFFDSSTSGQTTDSVGAATAKTTTEMKDVATFTDETTSGLTTAWDFETNPNDDALSNNYWDLDTGGSFNDGYPFLAWENGTTIALPVELTTFTGKIINGNVLLSWSTATEVNNYGFSIERKTENKDWNEIGFVNGAGNSNSPKQYSFTDVDNMEGIIKYRLKQIDTDGSFEYSDVIEIAIEKNLEYELAQNHPNPFNPTTNISFTIPEKGHVTLNVYNLLGEKISSLLNKELERGVYNYQFDARNLASGIYIYSISVNNFTQVKKMNLIK